MKEFLIVIIAERKTLLRAHLVSCSLVFPFTFLPTIIKHGWSTYYLIRRVPESALYTFGFCLIAVLVAIIHNYSNLVSRKNLYDSPAFKALDFYGRIDGLGSIVRELETFLLGEVDGYYYRLNLIDVDQKKNQLEIVPLIDLSKDPKMKNRLERELGFQQNWFFGLTVPLSRKDLNSESYILDFLKGLSLKLSEMNIMAVPVDERELHD